MPAEPSAGPRTWICRCEEVAESDIRRAIASGGSTLDDVKRRTRAGMGLCQGIYCSAQIGDLIAEVMGQPRSAIDPMTFRPPARPLELRLLADASPPASDDRQTS